MVTLALNFTSVSLVSLPLFVLFLFSRSTAKDKGEKKLFGFAFTPLMREDGTTLSDESHELYVYKVSRDRCRLLRLSPRVRTSSVLQKSASAENIQTHNSFSRRAFKLAVCKTSRESAYGAEFTDLITKSVTQNEQTYFFQLPSGK